MIPTIIIIVCSIALIFRIVYQKHRFYDVCRIHDTLYGNILLPFVCAGSMPELKTKIKKVFPCWRRQTRAVRPQTFPLSRHIVAKQVNTRALFR